jgi:hypothetical protein
MIAGHGAEALLVDGCIFHGLRQNLSDRIAGYEAGYDEHDAATVLS